MKIFDAQLPVTVRPPVVIDPRPVARVTVTVRAKQKPISKSMIGFEFEPYDEVERWLHYGEPIEPAFLEPDVVIREFVDVDFTDTSTENLQVVAEFLTDHGYQLTAFLVGVQKIARTFVRHLEDPGSVSEDDWRELVDLMNLLIPKYVARLALVDDLDDEPYLLTIGLVVQLWNLIVEDRPVVKCANANCQRYFSKQRGNPDASKRRSDTRFCTKQCATAQRVRELRAKRRAEAQKSTTKKGKKQ